MKRLLALALLVFTTACASMPAATPPVVQPDRTVEFTTTCSVIWLQELGREIPAEELQNCIGAARSGMTGEQFQNILRLSDEYKQHQAALEQAKRDAEEAAKTPPLPSKQTFIQQYQGNFGSIKISGCDLHNDSLFDPVLLVRWVDNKECFERMMQAHADRNDNRVVVSPAISYHQGEGGAADVWHEPARFSTFLADIRRHKNKLGETIEPLVIWIQGEHFWPNFLVNGEEGKPSPEQELHFARDIRAMAPAVSDKIAGMAVCWECRHQRDYITVGAYMRAGRLIAELFPNAWHGMHFIQDSSSASSWRCDPAQDPTCPASAAEGDDPIRGNEPNFWRVCRAEGWCDGLLFQFAAGDTYVHPEKYPNYTGQPGALGRWWEIVVRLGNDPVSEATAGGNRHGWVQADVLAFENIYDSYNGNAEAGEQYAIEFCKRALAVGGWGCGSASYRRGR